jgi:predicted DNA repair protein MutK
LIPWAITPLLMLGGAYLCFEGFEKVAHKFLHSAEEDRAHHVELVEALADPAVDMLAFEREKVKGAVRTDFILSAEIIVISLGTVAAAGLLQQLTVLTSIAVIMTVGVYGLVAGIVKLDDAGLYLNKSPVATARALGRVVLAFAPWLMKALSIVGTAAMFMVGGGILTHGLTPLHHAIEQVVELMDAGALVSALVSITLDALTGILAGGIVLLAVSLAQRAWVNVRQEPRHDRQD